MAYQSVPLMHKRPPQGSPIIVDGDIQPKYTPKLDITFFFGKSFTWVPSQLLTLRGLHV